MREHQTTGADGQHHEIGVDAGAGDHRRHEPGGRHARDGGRAQRHADHAGDEPAEDQRIDRNAGERAEMFLSTPVATNTSFRVPAPAMMSRMTAMSFTELP